MALSGSVTTPEYEDRSVTLNWTASQNLDENKSTVSWELVGSGSYSGWVMVGEIRVTINGSQQYYRSSSTQTQCYAGTKLCSGSVVISHNTDGTKSFDVKVEAGIYIYAINVTKTASFDLNTIPRASSISVGRAALTMGTAGNITVTKANSSFTHTISYYWGDTSDSGISAGKGYKGTICTKSSSTKVSWTAPIKFANIIPKNVLGVGTLICDTYNGNTLVGSKSITFKAQVPESVVPSISSIVLSDPNGYSNTFGGFVQTKSKLKVQVNASGSYNSTISAYAIVVDGTKYIVNPYESNIIIESEGSKTIDVTVTDSRGRTATASTTYPILEYKSPTILKLTNSRCDEDGTLNDEGAYVNINVAGKIALLNNRNTISGLVEYKPQDSEDWSTAGEITSGFVFNNHYVVPANTEKTFDIRFTLSDAFNVPTIMTSELSTAFTLMDFSSSGNGMSIGKVSQKDALEIALPTEFSKDVDVDGDVDITGDVDVNGFYKRNGEMSMANYINDISTVNNTDTWIPVVNDGKLQHTTKTNLVTTCEVDEVRWENDKLVFSKFGRIVICHLKGVTYTQLMNHTLSGAWIPKDYCAFPLWGTDGSMYVMGTIEFGSDGSLASYYYSNFESRKTWAGNWKLYGTCVWISNQ